MSHHVPSDSEDVALVLYKPVDNPLPFGPGIWSSSFIVSGDMIRGLQIKEIVAVLPDLTRTKA
jgi:hypothetical protein